MPRFTRTHLDSGCVVRIRGSAIPPTHGWLYALHARHAVCAGFGYGYAVCHALFTRYRLHTVTRFTHAHVWLALVTHSLVCLWFTVHGCCYGSIYGCLPLPFTVYFTFCTHLFIGLWLRITQFGYLTRFTGCVAFGYRFTVGLRCYRCRWLRFPIGLPVARFSLSLFTVGLYSSVYYLPTHTRTVTDGSPHDTAHSWFPRFNGWLRWLPVVGCGYPGCRLPLVTAPYRFVPRLGRYSLFTITVGCQLRLRALRYCCGCVGWLRVAVPTAVLYHSSRFTVRASYFVGYTLRLRCARYAFDYDRLLRLDVLHILVLRLVTVTHCPSWLRWLGATVGWLRLYLRSRFSSRARTVYGGWLATVAFSPTLPTGITRFIYVGSRLHGYFGWFTAVGCYARWLYGYGWCHITVPVAVVPHTRFTGLFTGYTVSFICTFIYTRYRTRLLHSTDYHLRSFSFGLITTFGCGLRSVHIRYRDVTLLRWFSYHYPHFSQFPVATLYVPILFQFTTHYPGCWFGLLPLWLQVATGCLPLRTNILHGYGYTVYVLPRCFGLAVRLHLPVWFLFRFWFTGLFCWFGLDIRLHFTQFTVPVLAVCPIYPLHLFCICPGSVTQFPAVVPHYTRASVLPRFAIVAGLRYYAVPVAVTLPHTLRWFTTVTFPGLRGSGCLVYYQFPQVATRLRALPYVYVVCTVCPTRLRGLPSHV